MVPIRLAQTFLELLHRSADHTGSRASTYIACELTGQRCLDAMQDLVLRRMGNDGEKLKQKPCEGAPEAEQATRV